MLKETEKAVFKFVYSTHITQKHFKFSLVAHVESQSQTRTNCLNIDRTNFRTVILGEESLWRNPVISSRRVRFAKRSDPGGGSLTGNCILNQVGVQIYYFAIFSLRVNNSYKVVRLVELTARYSAIGSKLEHFFDAGKIFRLYTFETQSHWNGHQDSISFVDLLPNFVHKNVAIFADYNRKTSIWKKIFL